ncbi:MAG: hypothetical protein ACM3X7_00215 [Solirubrobacterales bacterium]
MSKVIKSTIIFLLALVLIMFTRGISALADGNNIYSSDRSGSASVSFSNVISS